MDLNSKRKQIRAAYFPSLGLLIMSILGLIGFAMLYSTKIFKVNNLTMFFDCISKYGMELIMGSFFFFTFIFCWLIFF